MLVFVTTFILVNVAADVAATPSSIRASARAELAMMTWASAPVHDRRTNHPAAAPAPAPRVWPPVPWRGWCASAAASSALSVLLLPRAGRAGRPAARPVRSLQVGAGGQFEPPSPAHPFGTDELGRDVFSRILFGARISLTVALASAWGALAVALPLGLLAGYAGGLVDVVISRAVRHDLRLPQHPARDRSRRHPRRQSDEHHPGRGDHLHADARSVDPGQRP